jgi:hypothetical protein
MEITHLNMLHGHTCCNGAETPMTKIMQIMVDVVSGFASVGNGLKTSLMTWVNGLMVDQ